MTYDFEVSGAAVKVLADIEKNSLYGSAFLRSIQTSKSLGLTPRELGKAVREATKNGFLTAEDTTYTHTFKRGKRTISESIPTKILRLTEKAHNTLSALKLLAAGQDATFADLMRAELDEQVAALNAEIDAANDSFLAEPELLAA